MKNKTKILVALVAVMTIGFSNNSFAQRVRANINFSLGGAPVYYAPAPAYQYSNVAYYGHDRYERRRGWGRDRDRDMYRRDNGRMMNREGYAYRDRGYEAQRYNNNNNNNGYEAPRYNNNNYNGYNGNNRYR